MIEIFVSDRRTGSTIAKGDVIEIGNHPSRGDIRLLALSLDTGYAVKLYISLAEMEELLATFLVEKETL